MRAGRSEKSKAKAACDVEGEKEEDETSSRDSRGEREGM